MIGPWNQHFQFVQAKPPVQVAILSAVRFEEAPQNPSGYGLAAKSQALFASRHRAGPRSPEAFAADFGRRSPLGLTYLVLLHKFFGCSCFIFRKGWLSTLPGF